jgi:hypothetical protein
MTTKTQAAAVVLVSRAEDGTVTICDANGKTIVCSTADSYVKALGQILDDPTLPKIEDVPPQHANVEEAVVAGVKEVVPQFLQPFVRPGLQGLGAWLRSMSHKTTPSRMGRRRRRRAPTTPPNAKGRAA